MTSRRRSPSPGDDGRTAQDAIELDELLTSPNATSIVEGVRARTPKWFQDQQEATAAELARGLDSFAVRTTGSRAQQLPIAAIPAWFRLSLFDEMTRWTSGAGETCQHSPHPDAPQPIFAAAWRPGLMVCTACLFLLSPPAGSVASRRCDGCGHVVTGPDDDDLITTRTVHLGQLIFSAGTCDRCAW